eukprot:CAMPEP_0206590756 /NCGR_PEP_ID=MMETSP0325_2-20121206/39825_1 /ASSEMBLY_ACC=CAM_ASM_000347 /TAXON_ID=2866 /ORGANISM="Crypthecodinium cohnii, Strain Seligo" /LENGTH=153 /DNA_ID=CAMNT_0054099801 /DNA_START=29 /DNA_END=486 /DNA_ORIENTATION=+
MAARKKCAHENCDFYVHREVLFGEFCCGACGDAFKSGKAPEHDRRCCSTVAANDAPRAKVPRMGNKEDEGFTHEEIDRTIAEARRAGFRNFVGGDDESEWGDWTATGMGFEIGQQVQIKNMKTYEILNGERGEVIAKEPDGRWTVKLLGKGEG